MSTVVYGCICGACIPMLTYPVWWIVYYEHCCIWLHQQGMLFKNTQISSVMDEWRIVNTVVHGCICVCGACFPIITYPVWCIDGALWALLHIVASMEHVFQYSHIQCDGLCIITTVVYGCISRGCFPILTYPVWWVDWCIMSTVVYGCICGACFPILTYPVS